MAEQDPLASLSVRLPHHARLLRALREAVTQDDRWRWLELGCSLGSGGGDEWSDADVGVGYGELVAVDGLPDVGVGLARDLGPVIDALAHQLEGWPPDVWRVAAEYADGVQLDLVLMPATLRDGLPDRTLALVDKDDRLTTPREPPSRRPPSAPVAREWVVLAWWALSNAAKYLRRGSLFEATDSIAEARSLALRLHAAGRAIPYPGLGLVSLLDFPPFELPDGLAVTYCRPVDLTEVAAAADACARLLLEATGIAAAALAVDLTTPLADAALTRLRDARER